MHELLEARGTRIFKVLVRREDVEPRCRNKLQVSSRSL